METPFFVEVYQSYNSENVPIGFSKNTQSQFRLVYGDCWEDAEAKVLKSLPIIKSDVIKWVVINRTIL